MTRTKDEKLHALRRDEILQAAARVFKAKGFHLARTEEICAEAGLSAGTVFRHFASKQEMILAITEIELAHYKAEVQKMATKDGLRWLSRIRAAGLAELLRPTAFDLGADSWLELARDPQAKAHWLSFDAEVRATLSQALKRGQAEGWVRKSLDPVGAANLILAMLSGLFFDADFGAAIEPKATAKALSAFFSTFILSH